MICPELWASERPLMMSLSCFLALILAIRRSAHCEVVTAAWQATQRVLMFSNLHSPGELNKENSSNQRSYFVHALETWVHSSNSINIFSEKKSKSRTSPLIHGYDVVCVPSIAFYWVMNKLVQSVNSKQKLDSSEWKIEMQLMHSSRTSSNYRRKNLVSLAP